MRIRAAFRTRRGSIFLFTMVALFVLLVLGVSLLEVAVSGLARASDQKKRTEALALAESGVDMVLCKLLEKRDSADTTLADTGSYTSDFDLAGGHVDYTVTSPFQGVPLTAEIMTNATTWDNKTATVRVIAYCVEDVDRTFQGAIFSNAPLSIKGTVNILPDATGKGAQIYANGDITFDGGSATFEDGPSGPLLDNAGAIYTTGEVLDKQGGTPNITGVPSTSIYEHIAPFPMPVIDLAWYRLNATRTINVPRNQSYNFNSGNMTGLSGIIYVKGDATISGSYTGNALIVATGTISVTGQGCTSAGAGNSIGLLSPTSIKIAGGATIDGLVYAHGVQVEASIIAGGSATIRGAVVADVVVSTHGTLTIQYSDVWEGLQLPGKGRSQWARISWEELHP